MNLLVYKTTLAWPRRSGHDVHTFEMMRSWSAHDVKVHLACGQAVTEAATRGLSLESVTNLSTRTGSARVPGGLPGRYTRYWGIPEERPGVLSDLAREVGADAVIASGLDALPLLTQVRQSTRIWYAADELFLHHASLLRLQDSSTWCEIKPAMVKGLYERAFRRFVDRVWVVSSIDRRAMRVVAGIRNVDVIPNGVDVDYFSPRNQSAENESSAVFWGRLDFEPNVQALEWFCRNIWPRLLPLNPHIILTIMGARPTDRVLRLGSTPGVRILPDVDDLRPDIAAHQVVVLPFISGAGIKNKLLEAAAMGKAIVCSPLTVNGLCGRPPVRVASSSNGWVSALVDLWRHPSLRHDLGLAARTWVCSHHRWETSAFAALETIRDSRHP